MERLPTEVLNIVLSYLTPRDAKSALVASRRLCAILQDKTLQKRILANVILTRVKWLDMLEKTLPPDSLWIFEPDAHKICASVSTELWKLYKKDIQYDILSIKNIRWLENDIAVDIVIRQPGMENIDGVVMWSIEEEEDRDGIPFDHYYVMKWSGFNRCQDGTWAMVSYGAVAELHQPLKNQFDRRGCFALRCCKRRR